MNEQDEMWSFEVGFSDRSSFPVAVNVEQGGLLCEEVSERGLEFLSEVERALREYEGVVRHLDDRADMMSASERYGAVMDAHIAFMRRINYELLPALCCSMVLKEAFQRCLEMSEGTRRHSEVCVMEPRSQEL